MHFQPKPHPLRQLFHRLLAYPWELLILLAVFAWLYRQTMPPGISSWIIEGWDSAMFQVTGSTWGLAHSPGYPLYTILANLFVRWLGLWPGLGDTALVWRVSLWSTVTSLLTLVFVYFTIWRISHDRPAAMLSAVILGISFIFWRGAIMAEVYSLNALIFALTYWLALHWANDQRDRSLIALGLTIGAGIVHHRTAFILPPTVAWWILLNSWQNKKITFWRALRSLIILTCLACLPLISYAYLPWVVQHRVGQTWLYATSMDWNTFWFILVSREWWGLVHVPATPLALLDALQTLFRQQANQVTMGVILMGLLGLLLAYRYLWLFGPPLLALIFFGLSYKVADVDSMLMPLTLTLCLGFGIFIGTLNRGLIRLTVFIVSFIESTLEHKWISTTTEILIIGSLSVGSYLIFRPIATANYHEVDLSGDWQAQDLVEEVTAIAHAGTPLTIIGQDNSVLPDFIYAKVLLEQENLSLEPLSTTQLSRMPATESQALLQNRLAEHRRILVDKETIDLGFIRWLTAAVKTGRIFMAPTGHPYLWELLPRPLNPQLPPNETLTRLAPGQFLEGQVSVIATNQQIIRKRTGCFLRLTLFWQSNTPLKKDYFVAVQPLGGETVLDKNDHLALMRGYLPTSQLQPGEIVRDEIDMLIRQPAALPLVNLVVNLYQVQGDQFPTFGQVTLPITVDPTKCD